MSCILQFDISGLLVLFVILSLFFLKRTAPSYPNRTFAFLVTTIFIATIVNVITMYLLYSTYLNIDQLHILLSLSLLLNTTIPISFLLYALALTNAVDTVKRKTLIAILLPPIAINTILLLSEQFYPIFFRITEARTIIKMPLIAIPFGLSMYCIVFVVIILLKKRDQLPKSTCVIIFVTLFTTLCSALIQFFFPHIRIFGISISLNILLLTLTVQKPEDTSDMISGLYNQTAFEAMNHKRFKNGENFYIIGIVYDDLPFLTSTFGIRHINAVLKQTATFIKNVSKEINVYHFNDGKFCIVYPHNNLEIIYRTINTIKDRFLQPWTFNNIEVKIFPRTSIMYCPEDAESTEAVIEFFDLLSSEDTYKQEGVILASSMDTSIRKRSAYLDRTVKDAIINGLIDVFYQPIYCTKSKQIIGAEALVRMKNEKGKYISPEEFIPIAEKNGTILRIGEFVFEKVCRFLSEIKPSELGIKKIDVNLSVIQCMQETLAEQIMTIANLYKIPFSILNLEITETAAAYSQETLKQNMEKFSEAGIELSLDDYGSGYSNMSYMIKLPFDMIKIDKSIVWDAFCNEKSYTALEYTVSMINALHMTVLAEGIETLEQAEHLTKLGCHYLQGYYFSQPITKEAFLTLLRHQKIDLDSEKTPSSIIDNTISNDTEVLEELEEI